MKAPAFLVGSWRDGFARRAFGCATGEGCGDGSVVDQAAGGWERRLNPAGFAGVNGLCFTNQLESEFSLPLDRVIGRVEFAVFRGL